MDLMQILALVIPAAIYAGVPLILTALGGLFSERAGVVNIGLEGLMISGAFIGILIKKFEVGFKAGVKAVNPDAEIAVQYVESFNDQTTAQQIANTMYSQGADIIYHAAGDSGNGLFTEAINRARNGENVWVIGVDADQYEPR